MQIADLTVEMFVDAFFPTVDLRIQQRSMPQSHKVKMWSDNVVDSAASRTPQARQRHLAYA